MALTKMNEALFYAINGSHHPVWDQFMLLGSSLGAFNNLLWILLAGLLLLYLPQGQAKTLPWLPKREKLTRFLAMLVVSSVLMAAVVMGLKNGLQMPRPSVALPAGTVQLLTQPHSLYSFPSGHSACAMLLAALFWPWCQRPPVKALLIFFALWVGISRIILGLHFPVDVLAGYLCGGGAVWLSSKILSALPDRPILGVHPKNWKNR